MFEFDEIKSASNQAKHGVGFLEAQKIWDDPLLVKIRANSETEERFMVIGKINNKHWSAIYTMRDDMVRIISVRRSRKKEVILYEG